MLIIHSAGNHKIKDRKMNGRINNHVILVLAELSTYLTSFFFNTNYIRYVRLKNQLLEKSEKFIEICDHPFKKYALNEQLIRLNSMANRSFSEFIQISMNFPIFFCGV